MGGGALSGSDAMAKARSLALSRMGKSPTPHSPAGGVSPGRSSPGPGFPGGGFPNLRHPPGRPPLPGPTASAPTTPMPQGLSARRGMKLNMNNMGGGSPGQGGAAGGPSQLGRANGAPSAGPTKMDDFKKYIDAEKGWLTFEGAATITNKGVEFTGGRSFHMSLDEVDILRMLGKGNYGTVYKVRHARPSRPRFGTGLSQFRESSRSPTRADEELSEAVTAADIRARSDSGAFTGAVMAMKEIRLELDEAKFTTILKELVILHECVSPYIIDFYGAFFQEGAVYMCIEYMNGGSVDKLYQGGVPEDVLRRITYGTIKGLMTLKDDHNIIHRDVKPTNILVNTRGQVKICDFGVSGNLVASIAKTNIGCQSYMAPERISGGAMATGGSTDGTYSVQSDIWSLGLTIIECAMGKYPYPPEASSTIFSQLSAIVDGDPPDLPEEGYSQVARDFVQGCLNKTPMLRPPYVMLLKHPWLKSLSEIKTITEEPEPEDDAAATAAAATPSNGVEAVTDSMKQLEVTPVEHDSVVGAWVRSVLEKRGKEGSEVAGSDAARDPMKPALHAAPLDSVSPGARPMVGGILK
ncbi:related to tyrosine protein kinase of the MAP kinase kinase family [Cephalotrichum gorgonifer]|uniref:mitogen-activated protein kinase kinase n=1 Tax=Cephalotrichum gorgonifer TaxID=2041049 RepID=A0AAE8ST88_9PEZI|nr:related to tyrosine protein kinase of the MAP kinase kinase family [Cephalotrichum gorgonifer]